MPLRVAACFRARVGGRFSKRGSGGRGAASPRRGGAPRSGNFWPPTNRPRATPGELKVCGNSRGSSDAIEYFRPRNIRTRKVADARISDLGEGTRGFSPAGPSSLLLGGGQVAIESPRRETRRARRSLFSRIPARNARPPGCAGMAPRERPRRVRCCFIRTEAPPLY